MEYYQRTISNETRIKINNIQGELSKLKSAETWEKFPSGDDPHAPYMNWDFFELGNFLKWNGPLP